MGSTASQKPPTQAESFITSTNLDKMRWYYCPCSHEMQQRSTSIAGASEYHIGQSIQMQGCAVRWWLVVTRNSARRICTLINGTIKLTLWSKNQGFEKRQQALKVKRVSGVFEKSIHRGWKSVNCPRGIGWSQQSVVRWRVVQATSGILLDHAIRRKVTGKVVRNTWRFRKGRRYVVIYSDRVRYSTKRSLFSYAITKINAFQLWYERAASERYKIKLLCN